MIGLRLTRPKAHALSSLCSQFRPLYRFPPQLTHGCAFRTSSWNLEQLKRAKNDQEPASPRSAKLESELKSSKHEPKRDILSEVYTIPNLLTFSRIAATPFIGYFLATGQTTPAIAIFTYSCVSDFVDGYIARKYNMKSTLGSILDPAADKFLMTTCTVALAIPGSMPLYVASTIIGRDVLLSFMGFYVRYVSLPPPITVKRYLDLSISTHTVHPNLLGKVNTALQMFYIGGLVLKPAIESFWLLDLSGSFDWLGMFVAATTVCSGLTYVVGKHSFQSVLKPPNTK